MPAVPVPGAEFAGYRVLTELGRGAFGVVFGAEQLSTGRSVALKVLHPDAALDADFRARFEREARVLGQLDSPHIVQVLDSGATDGLLYLAMQHVHGGDLKAALAQGPLPVPEAVELALQLSSALSDAHAAGVLHRDVKPANVLLWRRGDRLHAYLGDFGVARNVQDEATAPGMVIGTYGYMPPERIRGAEATASGDLYALGCVLVVALTGRPPYPGNAEQAMHGHLAGPIPQLQDATPLADRLNHVLRRSLAKDAADRYASAEEMRADLLACRTLAAAVGGPVEATLVRPAPAVGDATLLRPPATTPATTPAPTTTPAAPHRQRVWLAAAAAAVLVLVGGGAAWWLVSDRDGEAAAGTTPRTAPRTSSTPSPTTPTPTPTPTPVPPRCWDGSTASRGTCDVSTLEALKAAFSLQGVACGPPRDPGSGHSDPRVNIDCGDVHYARYLSPATRADRLRDYGSERGGCVADPAAGTVMCGPNRYGRFVRTYSSASGILFYASSHDVPALEALPMLTADQLLHGTR